MSPFHSPISRVRWFGRIEGVSFLVLLGIAMPLKHLAGLPMAVRWVGWVHGVLFILLCLAILQAWLERELSFRRACQVFLAALLPFGPFLIDRGLASLDDGRKSD